MKVAVIKKKVEIIEVPNDFFEKCNPPHSSKGISQWELSDKGYDYFQPNGGDEDLLSIEEVDTGNIIAEW